MLLVALADVLTVLPRMQPRYYSITSSAKVEADKISITVGVLDAKTRKGAMFDGVCSHYLAGLRENVDSVSIKVRQMVLSLLTTSSTGKDSSTNPTIPKVENR